MNGLIYKESLSDSPYIDLVMHGLTLANEMIIRPAASHWHLVFSNREGHQYPIIVGPWTTSGLASWTENTEILWIRFKLGTFMPHMPTAKLLNAETLLPEATSKSFWLRGSTWQIPNYENIDVFVNRLVREELLVFDPVVKDTLEGHLPSIPSRTIRHRFLRVTGQSQNRILQLERAQKAMTLLQQGHSILDVVSLVGYADQPHLTRAFKHFLGYTPGQIIRLLP